MKRMAKTLGVVVLVALAAGLASTWEPDRPVSALEARWAPPPSTFVELEGLRVHLRDVGPRDDPSPLVLLHGTAASLHTWEGWVAILSPRHRVITLDLPGFGLTGGFPDGDATVAHNLKFLAALLQKLGVTKCVLVGNSYGGRLAWEFALAAPGTVEKLVLIDASGYARESTSVPIGFRIAQVPGLRRIMEFVLPRGIVEKSVRNVYGDPSKVTPALVDRYFELTLREGNRRALVERMEQVPSAGDVSRLAGLRAPTLILWGGKDQLIPPESARRFDADIPDSRLVVFDALGHVPHEEDPEVTAAALEVFLSGS